MTRDEAARAFAKKTGLTLEGCGGMGFGTKWGFARRGSFKVTEFFDFPASDAPLHEHLAFVGRVAEAIGPGWFLASIDYHDPKMQGQMWWEVTFQREGQDEFPNGWGDDISHSALLAALAALEAR